MNILFAFKAEPDSGMLAEKDWLAATEDTCGPDTALLRCSPGADEQAAAALLLAQRREGCDMTLTALSISDERALHWLRYLPRWVLISRCCWKRRQICALRRNSLPDK